MHADRGAVWAWALTIIGLGLSISSLLGEEVRVFLLCAGVALSLQAVPVWCVGHLLGSRRRERALEFLDRVGGRVTARLASDPRCIVGVDLSDAPICNADLDAIAGLRTIEQLDLSGTRIDAEGLELLGNLGRLRELDLTGTPVGNAGLAELVGFHSLRELHVGQTHVTAEAAENFLWARPDVHITPHEFPEVSPEAGESAAHPSLSARYG